MLRQIFVDSDIDSLLNIACVGKYEIKDRYLISQLAYVPLSLTEHNLLKLHQLMNDKGEIYRRWVLPAAYSRNKKDRIIEVPEVFCQALDHYLDWYKVKMAGRIKQKLALLLVDALSEKGAIPFDPNKLKVQRPAFNRDCANWYCSVPTEFGIGVEVYGWATMSECVKHGLLLSVDKFVIDAYADFK